MVSLCLSLYITHYYLIVDLVAPESWCMCMCMCSELLSEHGASIVSAIQPQTVENIQHWTDTVLPICVCVCSVRNGSATSPQCPFDNYILSEAVERAGAAGGKAWLQLSAFTLLLTTVYLCLSSVSSSISPPPYSPSDTKPCELTPLYCCTQTSLSQMQLTNKDTNISTRFAQAH